MLSAASSHEAGSSTVAQLLALAGAYLTGAEVDAPALTSLLLLEHATGLARERLLAHPEQRLSSEVIAALNQAVERRAKREPLAYIRGWREFFGRRFAVNSSTLIPRPETEGVVERALHWAAKRSQLSSAHALSALDAGTGSGAIAISLLAEVPSLRGLATDTSLAALQVAQANTRAHGVQDRLHLVGCDLAAGLRGPFSLVVANLPYIPTAELATLQPEIAYEPRGALDGGPDGTQVIRNLLSQLPSVLAPGGLAILEIGNDQGPRLLSRCATQLPGWRTLIEPDAACCDRYLLLERPPA